MAASSFHTASAAPLPSLRTLFVMYEASLSLVAGGGSSTVPVCTGTSAAGPTLPLCMAFCSSAALNGVQISILTTNIIPGRPCEPVQTCHGGRVPERTDGRKAVRDGASGPVAHLFHLYTARDGAPVQSS